VAMAAILLGTAVPAQVPASGRTILVKAARIIDGRGGPPLANAGVLIRGERIERVGPAAGLTADQVIDLGGATVLPGLIDLHTHLADGAIDPNESDPAAPLKRSEARTILMGAKAASIELRSGFTTVRDVGVYRGLTDIALRDSINAGEVEGPRMFVAGGYITTPGGGGEIDALAPDIPLPETFRIGEVHNPADARDRARYLLDHGADFIKLIATGAVLALGSEPGALELSPEEMKAACDEAKLRGSYCIAHAHGAEGIKAAIRAGVRTIEHASYLDAEGIALAKSHGVWLDMDIYNGDYINEVGTRQHWPAEYLRKNIETTDVQRRGFVAAVKAGAKMTFGTDAGVYPYGLGARQFAYMVRYGMTPMQAIQAATTEASRALRMEGQVGSVASGAYGDLIAVRGDPLSDIRVLEHVDAVVKEGRLVR